MKKLIVLCLTIAFSYTAKADILALRTSTTGEISADVALGKFSLGVNSWNPSLSSGTSSFAIKTQGFRAAYFFNGAFEDSWYFAIMKKDWEITVSGTDLTGTYTGTLKSPSIEYFFGRNMSWGMFNVMIGLGSVSLDNSDVVATYSGGGTKTESIPTAALGSFEFTIGLRF